MDFDDDPWARTSPEVEKGSSLSTSTRPDSVTGSNRSLSVLADDNAAWDATEGDGDDDEEEFVEATSRLNLSTASLQESHAQTAREGSTNTQSPQFIQDAFDDNDGFEEMPLGSEQPPVAGPSSTRTKQAIFDDAFQDIQDDDKEDDDFGDFGDDTTPANGAQDDDFGDFDDAGGVENDADFSFGDEDTFAAAAVQEDISQLNPSSSSSLPNVPDPSIPIFNPYFNTITSQPPPPDFQNALSSAAPGTSSLSVFQSVIDDFYSKAFPDLFGPGSTAFPDPPEPPQSTTNTSTLSVKDRMMPLNGTDQDRLNRKFYEEMVEEDFDLAKMMGKQSSSSGEGKEPWRWEWKKSKTRLRAMRQLGLPVNLDDFADPPAQPMAPLVLPSIRTTAASPSRTSTSNGRSPISRSASPSTSTSKKASSSTTSRSSPSHNQQQPLPPIDLERCKALVGIREKEMSFKTVKELNELREELQKEAVKASGHLTGLLERKEVLSGQNATYNAMIQDLVLTAQKIRSSSSPSTSAMRKPSLKRSTSNSKPSPGLGVASGPPSRPSSPAQTGLKSSLGRSAAAQSTGAGKEQVRRTSLW